MLLKKLKNYSMNIKMVEDHIVAVHLEAVFDFIHENLNRVM
jgi:hypothetical protein